MLCLTTWADMAAISDIKRVAHPSEINLHPKGRVNIPNLESAIKTIEPRHYARMDCFEELLVLVLLWGSLILSAIDLVLYPLR